MVKLAGGLEGPLFEVEDRHVLGFSVVHTEKKLAVHTNGNQNHKSNRIE